MEGGGEIERERGKSKRDEMIQDEKKRGRDKTIDDRRLAKTMNERERGRRANETMRTRDD